MSLKDVIDTIAESMKLAQRVETLADKITELARLQREDAKDLRISMHEQDKRIVRIETLIEITQLTASGVARLPDKG